MWLQTVDTIHNQVDQILQQAGAATEAETKQALPDQLVELFASIHTLRQECEAVPGPPALPELSDSIEHVKVGGSCFHMCHELILAAAPRLLE